MVAGGGVRGRDIGIARGAMVQVGPTIEACPPFIEKYLQAGGMTIGGINGKGINGTTNSYLTSKFSGTGRVGKRAGIGKRNKLGVSRGCNRKRDHGNNRNLRQENKNRNGCSNTEPMKVDK